MPSRTPRAGARTSSSEHRNAAELRGSLDCRRAGRCAHAEPIPLPSPVTGAARPSRSTCTVSYVRWRGGRSGRLRMPPIRAPPRLGGDRRHSEVRGETRGGDRMAGRYRQCGRPTATLIELPARLPSLCDRRGRGSGARGRQPGDRRRGVRGRARSVRERQDHPAQPHRCARHADQRHDPRRGSGRDGRVAGRPVRAFDATRSASSSRASICSPVSPRSRTSSSVPTLPGAVTPARWRARC